MSKKKSITTNAVRIIKAEKIPFETIEYEANEVGENFGVKIADLTGVPCERCFKTIVAKGREILVFCLPVDKELDLKKAAKAANMTTEEFARRVRGLLRASGCRDTKRDRRIFTAAVMAAISC